MDSERGLWMKHELAASVHHSNRIIRSFLGTGNTLYTEAVDFVVFRGDAEKGRIACCECLGEQK